MTNPAKTGQGEPERSDGRTPATEAPNSSINAEALERVKAANLALEDFLNLPPHTAGEEPPELRDYRHRAYRYWSEVFAAQTALLSSYEALQGEVERLKRPVPRFVGRLLTDREALVLAYLQDRGGDEYVFGFDTIAGDLHLSRKEVRDACRSLRALGAAHYCRATFNDDGETTGAGYGCTKVGCGVTGLPIWEVVVYPSAPGEDAQALGTPHDK